MGKRKGRARRCSVAVGKCQDVASELNSIADEMESLDAKDDVEEFQKLKEKAIEKFGELDWGEFESLKDEMESWRDGLQGTNLENSSTYSRLEETADILENVVSSLESVSEPDTEGAPEDVASNLRDTAQEIEDAASEADGCDFPGMYG